MRIINVIVIENNDVKDMESFPVIDEQFSNEVVEQAETYFKMKMKEYGADYLDEETIESYVEDGSYTGDDFNIVLIWTNVESI